jgi:phosphoglycolate phosphatase
VAKLLLFDVDDTLIATGGAGRRAMRRAFLDTFGLDVPAEALSVPGRTDRLVLHEIVTGAGRPAPDDDVCDEFALRYLVYLPQELRASPSRHAGIKPGVERLLNALHARRDVCVALLTGNLRLAAELKLRHFDLWQYFAWGVYGDRTLDRANLVPLAKHQYRCNGGAFLRPTDVWIIGDTPHDVRCARANGATSIAVATGSHNVETLECLRADHVFTDLSDTDAFLQLLNRHGPTSR